MLSANILICEDESLVARALECDLRQLGCHVTGVAESDKQVFDLVKSERPDLALMDIKLNGSLDGINIARFLRETFDIPVIYVTAFADSDTIERAKLTLPLGYLIKPYDPLILETTLKIALHRRQDELRQKSAENIYSSILNSIDVSVVFADPHGTISYCNPAAEELLGWPASEIIGQDWQTLSEEILKCENLSANELIHSLLRTGTVTRVLTQGEIDVDGYVTKVDCSLVRLRERVGREPGLLVVLKRRVENLK